MDLWEAFLYGLVQGLTEYLPISSSAHLILLPRALGTKDPGLSFDVFMHLGTLLSTLVYFRKDWIGVFRELFPAKNHPISDQKKQKVWILMVVGTLPALIAGAAFHSMIKTYLRDPMVLVITLAVGGVLLFAIDRFSSREKEFQQIGVRQALWVGLFQCLALIPGVSRSGSTITAGRLLGFTRESSARFSFLLSGPVTAAAVVFEMRHWNELLSSGIDLPVLIVGALSSFIFGWIAIDFLLKLVKRFSYLPFALYRVGIAIVVLLSIVS